MILEENANGIEIKCLENYNHEWPVLCSYELHVADVMRDLTQDSRTWNLANITLQDLEGSSFYVKGMSWFVSEYMAEQLKNQQELYRALATAMIHLGILYATNTNLPLVLAEWTMQHPDIYPAELTNLTLHVWESYTDTPQVITVKKLTLYDEMLFVNQSANGGDAQYANFQFSLNVISKITETLIELSMYSMHI